LGVFFGGTQNLGPALLGESCGGRWAHIGRKLGVLVEKRMTRGGRIRKAIGKASSA